MTAHDKKSLSRSTTPPVPINSSENRSARRVSDHSVSHRTSVGYWRDRSRWYRRSTILNRGFVWDRPPLPLHQLRELRVGSATGTLARHVPDRSRSDDGSAAPDCRLDRYPHRAASRTKLFPKLSWEGRESDMARPDCSMGLRTLAWIKNSN